MEEGLLSCDASVSACLICQENGKKTMQKKKRRETAEVTESSQEWFSFLILITAACLNSAGVAASHDALISHNKTVNGSLH